MKLDTVYDSLLWWHENIGFTNPNWNIQFYNIYSNWLMDILINDKNINIDTTSDFLNDCHPIILDYYIPTEYNSHWASILTFNLTAFYFIQQYHYSYFN